MVFKDLFDYIEKGTEICLVRNETAGVTIGDPELSHCRFVFGEDFEEAFEDEEIESIKPAGFVVGSPELQIWLK